MSVVFLEIRFFSACACQRVFAFPIWQLCQHAKRDFNIWSISTLKARMHGAGEFPDQFLSTVQIGITWSAFWGAIGGTIAEPWVLV